VFTGKALLLLATTGLLPLSIVIFQSTNNQASVVVFSTLAILPLVASVVQV